MREKLAQLTHEQWSGWMDHLFRKCEKGSDGTLIIPKWAVDRWQRQAKTPFSKLTPTEKDSDREEADRFLAIFKENHEGKKQ